jgi:hypothetical protein
MSYRMGAIVAALLLGLATTASAKDANSSAKDQKDESGILSPNNELLPNDIHGARIRNIGPKNAKLGDSFETGVIGARTLDTPQVSDLGPDWKDGARSREIGPSVKALPERNTQSLQEGAPQPAAYPNNGCGDQGHSKSGEQPKK